MAYHGARKRWRAERRRLACYGHVIWHWYFSQDFAKGKADFVRGLKADPSNSQLRKEVALLQKRVAAHKAKERKAFGGKLLK